MSEAGNEGSFPIEGAQIGTENEESVPTEGAQMRTENEESFPTEGAQMRTENEESVSTEGAQMRTENEDSVPTEGAQMRTENEESVPTEGAQMRTENEESIPTQSAHIGTENEVTFLMESSQIGKSLKSALECPVCLEYMVPPIMMCGNGHNVCPSCRPRLNDCPTCRCSLITIRNFALENLARELQLPCRNIEEGCEESLPVCDLNTHQGNCPFEPTYGCPLECEWTGRKSEIHGHALQAHSDKVLEGNGANKCKWELPLIVRDTRAIFAYGEVFRYRQRLLTLKKTFYIVVQYIGPREDASKFKYEVEVRTGSGEQKVMVMGNATLADQQNIEAVYESGNCITLDYDLVKNVALGKQLVYSVKVSKAGS